MDIVSIVEGIDSSRRHLDEIHAAAQHEVLVFDTVLHPELEASSETQLRLLTKGVPHRTIYDLTTLDIGERMGEIEERVAAGEQARMTTQRLPAKLSIIDRRIGAVWIGAPYPGQRVLLIHEPFLVKALTAQFEAFWERARPLSARSLEGDVRESGSQELSERDMHILDLLAAGEKDVAIARRLGASPVTIRRRIRRLIAALGVETRFQAGVAATKRGWL